MEHYKQLYIYEKYYMPDCPLFIEKYALTKDNVKNSIFAQIKLRNIGMKNILATYINVKCFDIENHELGEPIEYIYQDKVVARGEEFGGREPIYFQNAYTRKIIITCTKVVYEDGSVWTSDGTKHFEKSNMKFAEEILNEECLQQLKFYENIPEITLKHGIYVPQKLGKIDVCGCGAYNYNETDKVEEPCYNCRKTVKWWNKKVDEKYLQSQFDSRRKAEKEKELEKQRIEEEQRAIKKIEEERRRKKSIKTFAITASALVIIFGGHAIYKAVTPPTKEEQVSMDLEKFSDNGVLTEDLAKNHKSEVEKKAEEIKNSDYDTYCYIQAQLSLYADDNGFVAIKYLQQIKHTERFSDYNKVYDLCKDNM